MYKMEQTQFVEGTVSILLLSSLLIDNNRDSSENTIFCLLLKKISREKQKSSRWQAVAQTGISVLMVLKGNGHNPEIDSTEGPPLLSGPTRRSCPIFPTFSNKINKVRIKRTCL